MPHSRHPVFLYGTGRLTYTQTMSTTTARLASCAIVGLGASGTAAHVHYRMFGPHLYEFCDVSTTVSCTRVYIAVSGRSGHFKCRCSGHLFAFAPFYRSPI